MSIQASSTNNTFSPQFVLYPFVLYLYTIDLSFMLLFYATVTQQNIEK